MDNQDSPFSYTLAPQRSEGEMPASAADTTAPRSGSPFDYTRKSVLDTSFSRVPTKDNPDAGLWDVPGGGALPEIQPQGGTGGWGRYFDPSTTPGPNVGNVLPISQDQSGNLRLALPNIIRMPLTGLTTEGPQLNDQGKLIVPGVQIDPVTGSPSLTPNASAAGSLALPDRLGMPAEPVGPVLPRGPMLPRGPVSQVEMHAVSPPPAPKTPTSVAEAAPIRDAWYDVVDGNADAAVAPDYGTKGLDAAISRLQPQGPLSAATGAGGPAHQLSIKLDGARGQPITLGDFAAADRDLTGQVNQLYTAGNDSAGYQLSNVQADLRKHFEGAGPDNVVGGQEGFDALDPARTAHTQVSKMEDIESMIYKAGLPGAPPNSMNSQLRGYLTSPRSSNLSDMERAAAEDALRRGAIGTGLLGIQKLATPAVGALLGGGGGALGAAVTGEGVSALRSAIARARVQGLLDTLGSSVPPPPSLP